MNHGVETCYLDVVTYGVDPGVQNWFYIIQGSKVKILKKGPNCKKLGHWNMTWFLV
jgi:hypothetical protein